MQDLTPELYAEINQADDDQAEELHQRWETDMFQRAAQHVRWRDKRLI